MRRRIAYPDARTANSFRDKAAAASVDRIERDCARCSWRIRPFLRKIRDCIFSVELNVNQLHRGRNATRGTEAILFNREVGDSTWGYLSKARLETGIRLLRDTALRVEDIAGLTGYSERTIFTAAFKRWTGLTPEGFRKRCRLVEAAAGWPAEELASVKFLEDLRGDQLEPLRARRVLAFLEAMDPPIRDEEPFWDVELASKTGQPGRITEEELGRWVWKLIEGGRLRLQSEASPSPSGRGSWIRKFPVGNYLDQTGYWNIHCAAQRGDNL